MSNTEQESGATVPPEDAVTADAPKPDAAAEQKETPTVLPDPPPAQPEPPLSDPERVKWVDRAAALLLLVLTFLLASFAVRISEVWMHLATGRLIASGQYQFGVDPFSFATAGEIWVNHSWLSDLLAYTLFSTFGPSSLVIGKALIAVALAFVLLQIRDTKQPLLLPVCCVALALVVLSTRMFLRPVWFSYLFLAITLYVLHRAVPSSPETEDKDSEAPERSFRILWVLPPLFVLWVNMDQWFILGPLTVLLYLAGAALNSQARPALKPLGIVLGVGFLACFLSPAHIRAFQLPPDLAYIFARWIDVLPSWMVAGGETLVLMETHNPGAYPMWSPFSTAYFYFPRLGQTIAGSAYYVLLAIGLASFVLPIISNKQNAEWNWSRMLVFLFFAVLSIVLYRLIPFFAIVAGPIIVLNVQEYFAIQGTTTTDSGRTVTRFSAVALLLILIGLTWPGWLHARIGSPYSTHRVSWQLQPSESLRKATEKLKSLHQQAHVKNGFNVDLEAANYCAWFCPEVKTYVDNRFALFPKAAASYWTIRRGLLSQNQTQTAKGFRELGKLDASHNLDGIVLTRFSDDIGSRALGHLFWLYPADWPFLYGDGRTLIFGRNASKNRERFESVRLDFGKQAFGKAAEDTRPPKKGTSFPKEKHGFLHTYLKGGDPNALAVYEGELYELYHRFRLQRPFWVGPFVWANQASSLHASMAIQGAGAGSLSGPIALSLALRLEPLVQRGQFSVPRTDRGPASVPILMTRAARRAVAQSPNNHYAYSVLARSCGLIQDQENYWVVRRYGRRIETSRITMRDAQLAASLRAASMLDPTNPQYHLQLAQTFERLYFLDLAGKHLKLYLENFDRDRANFTNPKAAKEWQKNKKATQQQLEKLEKALAARRKQFDLDGAGLRDRNRALLALKRAILADQGRFQYTDQNNKLRVDPRGFGLKGLALEMLTKIDVTKLGPGERVGLAIRQIQLRLATGDANSVLDDLSDKGLMKALGAIGHELKAIAAAAVGDYESADKSLADLEKSMNDPTKLYVQSFLAHYGFTSGAQLPGLTAAYISSSPLLRAIRTQMQQLADKSLLRGLLALERGDPAAAEEFFQRTVDRASMGFAYPDLPIAERYLELIRKQR